MRKRIVGAGSTQQPTEEGWLDLERIAEVELTSEDPERPIENAFRAGERSGWRASAPGPQTIKLLFDTPQRVRRVRLHFVEQDVARTQEILLRWSADGGRSFRDIVRQQWNFSPGGTTSESEDYETNLSDVTVLELVIVPDVSGGATHASLESLRLA